MDKEGRRGRKRELKMGDGRREEGIKDMNDGTQGRRGEEERNDGE